MKVNEAKLVLTLATLLASLNNAIAKSENVVVVDPIDEAFEFAGNETAAELDSMSLPSSDMSLLTTMDYLPEGFLDAAATATSKKSAKQPSQSSSKASKGEFPKPYDPQPTLSSRNGKLEISLHLGVSGKNFKSTPNFVSTRNGFEANILGYHGCYSNGERCKDVNIRMGGPTLRIKPGEELVIHLFNDMPPEKCKTYGNIAFWNDFHQPMNTNIHVHGLFVPNSENNVLEAIYPGQSKTYNIKIRDVQQGGTHWYHPHAEGAVGLQAGGGALGLLVIEDLDDDIPKEIADLPEIGMRIQHTDFQYQNTKYAVDYFNKCKSACSATETAKALCGCSNPETDCSEPIFGIPAYKGAYSEALTVNGVENPTFTLHANQWYRVRTLYVPTYKRPIEPTVKGCDFKLLSKDGRYMPVTPRDIKAGYMFSGSRADFLIRCKSVGTFLFESTDTVPKPHNWATWDGTSNSLIGAQMNQNIYGQKDNAWTGVMAIFKVIAKGSNAGRLNEIRPWKVARPCYAPEMRDLTVDDRFYFIQGGLVPPAPGVDSGGVPDPEEAYPVFRYQPSTSWNGADPTHGNFYAVNNFTPEQGTTAFAGRLLPPKGAACDGKITNDYGECYGTPPLGQDFSYNIGDIIETDYYAPQIHPLHLHVFGYQITQLPEFSVMNDYFQVGDYHDNLLVPIAGNKTETQPDKPNYGKVVFRQHIYKLKTDVLVHCHFYRHSDRGMVALGNTVGTEGASSLQVVNKCYHGLTNRKFVYVPVS